MGIKGVGLAIGLSNLIIFAGLNIYPMFVRRVRRAIRMPTLAAVSNLGEYL